MNSQPVVNASLCCDRCILPHVSNLQAACGLWYPPDDAAPGGYVCPSEAKGVFRNKKACVDECIEASWGWDYVSCLEQVIFSLEAFLLPMMKDNR